VNGESFIGGAMTQGPDELEPLRQTGGRSGRSPVRRSGRRSVGPMRPKLVDVASRSKGGQA
jgi:hypothetical protein